jgi:hypothetical protein
MPHFKISCIVPYIPTKASECGGQVNVSHLTKVKKLFPLQGVQNCWQFIYNSEVKQFML